MVKRPIGFLEGRKCCTCRSTKTNIDSYGRHVWRYCKCGKKGCTGFLCNNCYGKARYKNFDGSYIAQWRIGDLGPLSSTGKGFIGQQIIAKTYGIEDCNLKMDNFRFYVDISDIEEYGYSEVKIATLIAHARHFSQLNRSCDTFFFVCMDRYVPWKCIKRIYAVPEHELYGITDIRIYEDFSKLSRGGSKFEWIEDFRIKDISSFNNTYHSMKLENCKVLRKDI